MGAVGFLHLLFGSSTAVSDITSVLAAVGGIIGIFVGGYLTLKGQHDGQEAAVTLAREGQKAEAQRQRERHEKELDFERKRQEVETQRQRERHEEELDFERKRQGAAIIARREREQEASEAAQLLLKFELGNARDSVYDVRKKGKWPIGWRRTWSLAWHEFRQQLLLAPPAEEVLSAIAAAFARIDQLEKGVNTDRDKLELGPGDQLFLWEMQQLLEPACKILKYEESKDRPRNPTKSELDKWKKEMLELNK